MSLGSQTTFCLSVLKTIYRLECWQWTILLIKLLLTKIGLLVSDTVKWNCKSVFRNNSVLLICSMFSANCVNSIQVISVIHHIYLSIMWAWVSVECFPLSETMCLLLHDAQDLEELACRYQLGRGKITGSQARPHEISDVRSYIYTNTEKQSNIKFYCKNDCFVRRSWCPLREALGSPSISEACLVGDLLHGFFNVSIKVASPSPSVTFIWRK